MDYKLVMATNFTHLFMSLTHIKNLNIFVVVGADDSKVMPNLTISFIQFSWCDSKVNLVTLPKYNIKTQN